MHEFQLLHNGDSALLSFYQTVPYDLSPEGLTSGLGYMLQSGFQEVDVASGAVLFEWYSLDHVDPSASKIAPGISETSGDGRCRHLLR